MSDTIGYELAEGVATLTLQRPDKLNAFNDEMLIALEGALKQAERDPEVRCVVLTGAGRGFSAGQDLSAVQDRDAAGGMSFREHLEKTYNRVIKRIRTMEKPVIGAINGVAAGAGASLALACDLRIASQKASFIQSFIGVGLVPDSGSTFFLPRMIGFARAFELAITAERLSAEEAQRLGLVNRVSEVDHFADDVRSYAAKLAGAPTKAIGLTKRAMNRAMTHDLESTLEYEAQLQEIAGNTHDHHEGVTAFLEKRAPKFEGR